ncbi:hypothetical protein [Acidovorax sp. BL-A-41-H1]|uniref:hypothetical protein n=1 Tax=Acidovorax sp. BL-A-41-H1 TaxID=3421102 RepID=UPI003F79CDCC
MYALDTQAARHADTAGATIKELGKYVGEFIQAQDIVTKKGGRGVSFIFKSASGQKANLAIYTTSADGERYQGYDTLMAIMTCMQLRGIKPAPGKVTRYDYEAKKEVQEDGTLFPDLHKPIGVLLETEDYEKQDGSVGTRMVLKNVFQANTELTASEILDKKTQPVALAKMVDGLRHRPLKGARPAAPRNEGSAGGPPAGHPASSGFDSMADDIPW